MEVEASSHDKDRQAQADAPRQSWGRIIAANTFRRAVRDHHAVEQHAAKARAAAARAAARLAQEPGVKRVILFGSLAGAGGIVHLRSDIDLAVEGLAADKAGAVALILGEIAELPVDLVRWEEAGPALRRVIEEDGEVLYVAPR